MRKTRGFTLTELAIVLLILALLGSGALSALRIQTERARFGEARSQVAEAREALLNYAAVERRLPCADANDDGEPDCGQPCPDRDGDGKADSCRLPWAALGVVARDPWGQRLNYLPSANFTHAGFGLTSTGELSLQDVQGGALANKEAVAFVVWSTGPDTSDSTKTSIPQSLTPEAPGTDDIVMWTSRFVLLGHMLEAGWDAPAGNGTASKGN